jgi:ubiquitin fusion degradation protein 1
VQFAGEEYNLRVLQLEPAPAVSVIDTDIAADVGPSIETEGYLRAQAEAAAREAERQRQHQEQAEREAAAVRVMRCKWGCLLACSQGALAW